MERSVEVEACFLSIPTCQCFKMWTLNLLPAPLQSASPVWPLYHSSICLFLPCVVCLTHSTCLSHFLWTHSVSSPCLSCHHTLLHKWCSDTVSPHCSVICFCRCQMCYSIHSPRCSSLPCHRWLCLFLYIRYWFKTFFCPIFPLHNREALLAEMGVAIREDGGTLGVFSPKKVQ